MLLKKWLSDPPDEKYFSLPRHNPTEFIMSDPFPVQILTLTRNQALQEEYYTSYNDTVSWR